MWFPIDDLLDGDVCYRLLLTTMHSKGLHCPTGHALPPDQAHYGSHREPFVDYRCRVCGAVFNLFIHTPVSGIRFSPARLVMILRGFCQGVSTLLNASHIVPWASNEAHRLDPANGIALNRLHDAAFDRALISFDEELRRVRQAFPPQDAASFFNVEGRQLAVPLRHPLSARFLAEHLEAFRRADF